MAIERESTRLFREARRARRMIGDRAGEAAAAQVGEYAAKVAATEPAGIGSREERMARQSLRRQSAALASGFRPEGGTGETTAATGNVLNARQNLFKKMQAAGPESAAGFRKEAAALGVTDLGFDRALRSVGGTSGTANTPTAPATTPTPAPTTTPASTAANQDNIPLFLRRTQQAAKPTAGPVSKIDGMPAEQVLSGASVGLSKADILRKAREESATNPSVTRQDVIDRMNAERRAKGFADVDITGKELAAADIEQQTNVEATRSLQGQKFFNTMDKIESSLNPPKSTASAVPRLLERPAETNVPTLLRRESAAPAAPSNPTAQSKYESPAQMYGDLSRAAGPPQPILDQYGRKPKRMPVLSSAADLAEYDRVMAQGTITGQDIRNAGSAVKRGVQSSVRYLEELPNRTNAWSNRVSEKLRRDLGIQ